MKPETITIEHTGSAAYITLNRPAARNAMNQQMVRELLDAFTALRQNRAIRVIVLGAAGSTFCAGGDIKELRADLSAGQGSQYLKVEIFEKMLQAVMRAPQVVIARIQGAAMGGGVALVCAADIAVAANESQFGLPEVRLGVVPAVISPYIIAKVGLNKARELMLTGARLDGQGALAAGLVNHACPAGKLDDVVRGIVNEALQASPEALAACKALLFEVAGKPPAETLTYRVDLINQLRAGPEGQEGMMAFLQKRPPKWVEQIEK